MRIAVFDYKIISSNPSGGCHLSLLRSLSREHEFTVFSVQFENPDPAHITWVHIPVPTRPLALLFISFHLIGPWIYMWHKLRTGKKFDVVQSVESNLCFGELIYAHFSHTRYLRQYKHKNLGLRSIFRWVDHWLHMIVEQFRYSNARLLVTPSYGLANELRNDFSITNEKIRVIANPIHIQRMERPANFARSDFRRVLGLTDSDLVIVFAALGQFERKGLPQILESFQKTPFSEIKLLVVGGESDLVSRYQRIVKKMDIENRVFFVGMQADVRPFLWSSDAFILASTYESFSLITYEAAASGLPILAPNLSGICDLLRNEENGFFITRDILSITNALERMAMLPDSKRLKMGENARIAAASFTEERFAAAWRNLYRYWEGVFLSGQQAKQKIYVQDLSA